MAASSGKEKLMEEEEVLQAVILADSFNKRFRPLTTRKPRVRAEIFIDRAMSHIIGLSATVSATHLQRTSAGLDV